MADTRRSVALELAGIGAAALVFVATFRIRAAWVDFALGGAAVALILASGPRSRRLWSFAPAPGPGGARAATRVVGAFTAVALLGLGTFAVLTLPADETWQARFLNPHFLLAAPLYLLWGLLQQYLFQFYWLGRWQRLVPLPLALAITAAAFAAVHFPRWPVMALTLVAGAFWSYCYHRWRALLPLAVSHGVLGSALHFWVFDRDLLAAWLTF